MDKFFQSALSGLRDTTLRVFNSTPGIIKDTIANQVVPGLSPIVHALAMPQVQKFAQNPAPITFNFADKIKNPVGNFAAQIPQGLLNTPADLLKSTNQFGNDFSSGKLFNPKTYLSDVAAVALPTMNLLPLGGAGTVAKSIGEQTLKQSLIRGAVTGAKYGAGFGALQGLKSGRDINDPLQYFKNLTFNTGLGAAGGALFGSAGDAIATGGFQGAKAAQNGVHQMALDRFQEKLVNMTPDNTRPAVALLSTFRSIPQETRNMLSKVSDSFNKGAIGDPTLNKIIENATNRYFPQLTNENTISKAHFWSDLMNINDGALPRIPHPALQKVLSDIYANEGREVLQSGKIDFSAPIGKDRINQAKVGDFSNSRAVDPRIATKFQDRSQSPEPLPWETTPNYHPTTVELRTKKIAPKDMFYYTPDDIQKQAGTASLNAIENPKGFNDIFAKWVGKREAAKTTATELGYRFKEIPKEDGMKVITALENPELKTTDKIKSYVADLHKQFDDLYAAAIKDGVDIGYQKNYITHFWDKEEPQVQQEYRIFKQKEFIQNDRTVPTYAEGIQMGLKPKYNHPTPILADYAQRLERLKANLEFIKEAKTKGFIVDAPVGMHQADFVPINAPGFPQSISRGVDGKVVVGSYYAPQEFANIINRSFGTQDSGTLGKVLAKTGKFAGGMQNLMMSGGIPGTPVNAFTLGQVYKEVLAGHLVSPVSSTIRSLSSEQSMKFLADNAGQIKKMQLRNVPVRSSFNIENVIPKTFQELVEGGGKKEIWNKLMEEPTFGHFLPMLQINLFNDIEKQALKDGLDSASAADVAANAVKKFYGIKPSDEQAKSSKLANDAVSTVFFAPKFRESMINFWKETFKAVSPIHGEFNNTGLKKVIPTGAKFNNPFSLENRNNTQFAIGAVAAYVVMDQINYKLTGRHMKDNPKGTEDKLLIPIGNDNYIGVPYLSSIATVPRTAYKIIKDVVQGDYAQAGIESRSLLSSPLKPLGDVAANENYFGSNIYDQNDSAGAKNLKIGKYLFGQYAAHPYVSAGLAALDGKPAYQVASQATELPLRFYNQKQLDAKSYFARADEAKKKLNQEELSAMATYSNKNHDPNDPENKIYRANLMLRYPKVYFALRETAAASANGDMSKVDPLYVAAPQTVKALFQYERLPNRSSEGKQFLMDHPEVKNLLQARGDFFDANPIPTTDTNKDYQPAPRPSPRVQQMLDAKNYNDPETQAFLNASSAYANMQRAKLGYAPLDKYGNLPKDVRAPYSRKPKKFKVKKVKIAGGKKLKLAKIKPLKKGTTKLTLPKIS